jgi:hypothetical protein
MCLLKLSLDQNSIVVYHKFNGDFKSHINFGRTKGGHNDNLYHYSFVISLKFLIWTMFLLNYQKIKIIQKTKKKKKKRKMKIEISSGSNN